MDGWMDGWMGGYGKASELYCYFDQLNTSNAVIITLNGDLGRISKESVFTVFALRVRIKIKMSLCLTITPRIRIWVEVLSKTTKSINKGLFEYEASVIR
jgi:hypothetical protein